MFKDLKIAFRCFYELYSNSRYSILCKCRRCYLMKYPKIKLVGVYGIPLTVYDILVNEE